MRTAEEAVLLAALEEDRDEVRRRLQGFLLGERAALLRACLIIREVTLFELRDEQSTNQEVGEVQS